MNTGTIEHTADAERWVKVRAARDRLNLDPGAVRALVDRAGLDIVRLRSGLERVALYAMGQPTVTADDVKQAVAAGPQAQEDFGIANAIQDGDAAGALRQLAASLDAGGVPFMILGQLRWVAEKLPAPADPGGRRGSVPNGPRAQILGRRPAHPAGAAGGGAVRERGTG